jgi:PAS domain S-box-containing protein
LARTRLPIFVLDSAWRLLYANPAFETLTGCPLDEQIGQSWEASSRDAEAMAPLATLTPPAEARQGSVVSSVGLITEADGERRPVRLEFRPLMAGAERVVGVLGLIYPASEPAGAPESRSHGLRVELERIRLAVRPQTGGLDLIGSGPAHQRLLSQIRTAAATISPAWIVAEPGAGARTVAAAIHRASAGSEGPLLTLDVAALPPEELERPLWAVLTNDREPVAASSTLLLVGASGLGRDLQARLVAALPRFLAAGIRILATSNADPRLDLEADQLRDDFYYAMTGLVLTLPPLRERLAELPLLAQHFLERANRSTGVCRLGLTPAALEALRSYDWPGNLAELERVIRWAHERAQGDVIDAPDLPATIRGEWACAFPPPGPATPELGLDATLEAIERRLIERALQLARFNKSRAADRLGISRPRLYRRMQELGIADQPEATETRR